MRGLPTESEPLLSKSSAACVNLGQPSIYFDRTFAIFCSKMCFFQGEPSFTDGELGISPRERLVLMPTSERELH